MGLPSGRKNSRARAGWTGFRRELAALAAVLLLAVLSWQMINAVATSLYRQYEVLGDPSLLPIVAAGPELGRTDPPARPPSQLGHIGYFWSERAFHYRTSLMFAVDDFQDPEILARDIWQQHPAGVDSWREYALLMEPVYGFLYRLAGDQARPFAEFLLRLIPLIHVLVFFPLYAVARALGCRRIPAVLGVVFYATCTMGFVRMTGSLLLKEDFALLCLAVFLAVHFWSWRRRSIPLLVLAAVLLIPVLAGWHLSQFLVLVVMLGAAVGWAAHVPTDPAPDRKYPFELLMPAAYTLAGLLAALTPSLLARGFFISLPMSVLYAWTIVAILATRQKGSAGSPVARLFLLTGLIGALGALVFLNRGYTGDYNHVFGLFVQKLVHGFRLPVDPGQLPFDSRVFWAPPFNSPTGAEIWAKLGFHAGVVVPVMIWCLWAGIRRGIDALARSFLLTVPAFLAAYLLIERLGVVFLVFAAIAVAVAAERLVRRLTPAWGGRALPVVAGMLLISPVLNLGGNLGDMIRITRSVRQGQDVHLGASDQRLWRSWTGMFSWVTANTPGPGSRLPGQPAAFLGEIGVSPQLLLYTGRPIVMNSQFENAAIRHRYRRYLEALYATDETVLWDFAREHGADFLFINRNLATGLGPGSLAYQAGIAGPLTMDMNVVKLHFRPEILQGFIPVYDNEHYRIMKVAPASGSRDPVSRQSDHNSWWHLENFQVNGGELVDPAADRARLAAFEVALSNLQDRQREIVAGVERRWLASRGAGARRPDLMLLHRQYVQAKLDGLVPGGESGANAGRLENNIRARLSEIDPRSGQPLAAALTALAHGDGGWVEQLSAMVGDPNQHATCGQLMALAGRYGEAADRFGTAAAYYPPVEGLRAGTAPPEMQIRLWVEQVWWNLAAGRIDQARRQALVFAAHSRAATREGAFFRSVGAIPGDIE
ncbi:MAG: hypothetical protein ABFS42_07465 [Candidatus Krumholzibacteriota bacterium]